MAIRNLCTRILRRFCVQQRIGAIPIPDPKLSTLDP